MQETKKYVLTVEGETEKLYFQWLSDAINREPSKSFRVVLQPIVCQSPRQYYKRVNSMTVPELYHICDIESSEASHISKFESILKEMREAKKQKNIHYTLGYSNFTFELWMILHKKNCSKAYTHRKQYLRAIQSCFGICFENLDAYKEEVNFNKCLNMLTLSDVKTAIIRAEKITQQNQVDGKPISKYCGYSYYKDNPALSIHEVVKLILQECDLL